MRLLLQSTPAYGLLKAEREENRLNHAYLLIFDDARNLRPALKEFSKLFFSSVGKQGNDEKEERIFGLIDEENFSDCIILPQEGKKFSVEDAEKIAEESALKPVEGDKKLFVIGDFAEATVQAQNKLLKLLEEPPKNVYFLLGATVDFPVLSTVVSRTERLEISPFSMKETTECLKRIYPNLSDVGIYAAASGGIVGMAQNILEGGYYEALLADAFELAETDPFRLPALVKKTGETKYKKELVSLLRLIFRDALLLKTSKINGLHVKKTKGKSRAEKYLMLKSEAERLDHISDLYRLHALVYAQEALSKAEKQIRFNSVFPQCLEICMAKILEQNNR